MEKSIVKKINNDIIKDVKNYSYGIFDSPNYIIGFNLTGFIFGSEWGLFSQLEYFNDLYGK